MARPGSQQPTELELDILKVLWHESPLLVREVREQLADRAGRQLTHSSVITILNIMVTKGFLQRKKQGRALVFGPMVRKDRVSQDYLRDVLTRVFDRSAVDLVSCLLENKLSKDELSEIRRMITRRLKDAKD